MGARTGLYFIDQCSSPKDTEVARCIQTRYNAGIINYPASNSGVMEVHAVLTTGEGGEATEWQADERRWGADVYADRPRPAWCLPMKKIIAEG